jgi:hypothetical protein
VRWKFQYSLSSLLWFTLCLALVLSSVLMYRRMEKAEGENSILRQEAGYLVVGDERLLHAVNIKTYDPQAWRWRFSVPAGRRFEVKAYGGEIPTVGMPKIEGQAAGTRDVAGEMVLNAALRQDKDGKWELYFTFRPQKLDEISTGGVEYHASIPIPKSAVRTSAEANFASNSEIIGLGGAVSQTMDKPIILLRHRFLRNPPSTTNTEPGIMIWLEEKK